MSRWSHRTKSNIWTGHQSGCNVCSAITFFIFFIRDCIPFWCQRHYFLLSWLEPWYKQNFCQDKYIIDDSDEQHAASQHLFQWPQWLKAVKVSSRMLMRQMKKASRSYWSSFNWQKQHRCCRTDHKQVDNFIDVRGFQICVQVHLQQGYFPA